MGEATTTVAGNMAASKTTMACAATRRRARQRREQDIGGEHGYTVVRKTVVASQSTGASKTIWW